MEEAKDLNSLRLDRMERMAQCVLSSGGEPSGAVEAPLIVYESSSGGTKRRASRGDITLDPPLNKKQTTKRS
jgi:hypothetical protein